MLYAALVLFLIGGSLGGYIVHHIFQGKPTPKTYVYLHGIVNAIGLILVIINVIETEDPQTAMIFLLLAAGGGLILFTMDMMKRQLPRALVIIHPIVALIGVLLLIVYIISAMNA